MIILDLRLLGFALLLALISTMAIGVWLGNRLGKSQVAPSKRPDLGGFELACEHAPFGLVVMDGARAYRYANACAQRLLNLRPLDNHLSDAALVNLLEDDRVAARGQPGITGRFRTTAISPRTEPDQDDPASLSDSSSRFVRWWIAPSAQMDLVFLLDVTAQRRADDAARSLINDLSHELRTPLATILTHLEVLDASGVPEEIQRQSTRLLKDETRRMVRLVHRMLELGRLQTSSEVDGRPLNLVPLLEDVVSQLAPLADQKSIDLVMDVGGPLPRAIGEADLLRQLFLNLLDNAVKYCRAGDRVEIALRPEEQSICCVVQDSGPGIPRDHLPYVTHRFYRAAPGGSDGSGLGLALAEEVLRRHGATLEIESQAEGVETGTCIRFHLPAELGAPGVPGEV